MVVSYENLVNTNQMVEPYQTQLNTNGLWYYGSTEPESSEHKPKCWTISEPSEYKPNHLWYYGRIK